MRAPPRFLLAVLAPTTLAVAYVAVVANGFGLYGNTLFTALPAAMTILSMTIQSWGRRPSLGELTFTWLAMLGATGLALVGVGAEGFLCIMMALGLVLAIGLPFVLLGCLIACVSQRSGRPPGKHYTPFIIVLAGLPLLTAMEFQTGVAERIFNTSTSVVINAPREVVWRHVVSFGEIGGEPAWYFRRGVAYPLRARIEGTGVGAVRYCEFSTGPFVEPITVWDEPNRLAFDVQNSPPAMTEWNPFHKVAPPHIDDYFQSHRGQFLLEDLGDGRTLLTGTTCYSHRIAPSWYWNLWTEFLLHDIHNRVLRHAAELAEADAKKIRG